MWLVRAPARDLGVFAGVQPVWGGVPGGGLGWSSGGGGAGMGVGRTPRVPRRVPTSIPCPVVTVGVIVATGGRAGESGATGCQYSGWWGSTPRYRAGQGP
jgi:hypothetical protein